MGDFNAKLGKQRGTELNLVLDSGIGQLLADFMMKEELFMLNSFFRKSEDLDKSRWLHQE